MERPKSKLGWLLIVAFAVASVGIGMELVGRFKTRVPASDESQLHMATLGTRCYNDTYDDCGGSASALGPQWKEHPSAIDLTALMFRFELGMWFGNTSAFSEIDGVPGGLIVPIGSIPLVLYYQPSPEHLIVVVRGTSNLADWRQNIKYRQVPAFPNFSKSILVHEGFRNEYLSVEAKLAPLLMQPDLKRVSMVGHSMGCGVAAISTMFLNFARPTLAFRVLLLASPRIGNPDAVASLAHRNNRILTVINLSDIIPTLPPSVMPAGLSLFYPVRDWFYRHFGTIVTYDEFSQNMMDSHSVYSYWTFLNTHKSFENCWS
jgi:hypothetical protein